MHVYCVYPARPKSKKGKKKTTKLYWREQKDASF
jgi:hypothetical protein